MNDLTDAQRERVMADLRIVIADAEELLRQGTQQDGAATIDWRTKAEARIEEARNALRDMRDAVYDRARSAGHAADDYVNRNPWQAIGVTAGIAAAAGLLIGFLLGRR